MGLLFHTVSVFHKTVSNLHNLVDMRQIKTMPLLSLNVVNDFLEVRASEKVRISDSPFYGQRGCTDKVAAAKYFERAADQNSARGPYQYGRALSEGFGISQDCVESAKYLKLVADQKICVLIKIWLSQRNGIGSLPIKTLRSDNPAMATTFLKVRASQRISSQPLNIDKFRFQIQSIERECSVQCASALFPGRLSC
jgi:TPR repeat protein